MSKDPVVKPSKEGEEAELEHKKSEAVLLAYKDRLINLKKAQEFMAKKDVAKGVENYLKYLKSLAAYFEVKEVDLSPSLFDKEDNLTELLLISHAYWDLAKAYDRSPRLEAESVRCLNKFVQFTVGFKYQHVNAEMVRRYIKNKAHHNKRAFQSTYERIEVRSKSCYVATYCYGENHPNLEILRKFRDKLLESPLRTFVFKYYLYSPDLIKLCKKRPLFGKFLNLIFMKPLISAFVLIIKKIDN